MPQLQPFYYMQELGTLFTILFLLTIIMTYYILPKLVVTQAVRRYLTSL